MHRFRFQFKFDNSSSKNSILQTKTNSCTKQLHTHTTGKRFRKNNNFFLKSLWIFRVCNDTKIEFQHGFLYRSGMKKKNLVAVAAIKVSKWYYPSILANVGCLSETHTHNLFLLRDSFCLFACIFCLNEFFFANGN